MGYRMLESRIDPYYVYYFPLFLKAFVSKLMLFTGRGMQLTIYLQKI